MSSRAEITSKYARVYARASKKDKGRILDQVVEVTGWSRDNTRRRLTQAVLAPGRGRQVAERPRKPRAPKYSYDALKVLGNGELTKSLKISAHHFSRSATEKIEKAGGHALALAVDVRNCVFRETGGRHPDLACGMHRAYLEGVVQALGGTPSGPIGADGVPIRCGGDCCHLVCSLHVRATA